MSSGPNTLLLLLRLVVSLGLVLAVLGAGVWALRRRGALRAVGSARGDRLEVLDRTALSKHAALALVRSGGRTFLVGATEHGVSVLGDWIPPEDDDATAGADPATTPLRPAGADRPATAGAAAALLLRRPGLPALGRGAGAQDVAARAAQAALPGAPTPTGSNRQTSSTRQTSSSRATSSTAQTTATRWTGSSLPEADGPGAPTRMGFVEALRELTVRRS